MSALEAAVAPDLPAAIETWRVWRVTRRNKTYQLGSVGKPTLWPRGEPLVAECLHLQAWPKRFSRRHLAPEPRCECGIYGADLARIGPYLMPAPFEHSGARVLGQVSLWGTVVECERGFRASHAYPLVIYVPTDAAPDERRLNELTAALGEYGVPVEVLGGHCIGANHAVARLM